MKIIITGVAGFMGSNLAKRLLDEDHEVCGIDNLSFGSLRNLEGVMGSPRFRFIEKDLRNEETLAALKGDMLVHLASQKIPRYSNSYRTLDDNAVMLKNAVKKCTSDKIKIVYASTSDVYGKNPHVPYHENSDLLLGPTTVKRWAYALSKIYGEHYLIACKEEFGLEFTVARFFGSYGINQNLTWWGGPQSVFIQNILEGKPLEIHGDGKQTRTFTYIDDTVEGIMKCMFHPHAKNEIFNVANEPSEEISIHDLALLIWEMMKGKDSEPGIRFIPYTTFGNYEDVRRRVPAIEKISTLLGFTPRVGMREGLQRTIAWQKQLH